MSRNSALWPILLVTVILTALASVLPEYWLRVLVLVLFTAYVAGTWNLLSGIAGQVSLGHVTFVGIGAYVSTLLFLKAGVNPWIGLVAGALAAAAAGVAIGWPTYYYQVRGAYFCLLTLSVAQILYLVAINVNAVGGSFGMMLPVGRHDPLRLAFAGSRAYAYIFILLWLALTLLVRAILGSRFGYYLRAIHQNVHAAAAAGVPVLRCQLYVTALSTGLAALAGSLISHYLTLVDPGTMLSVWASLQLLIYPVVGGVGTLWGPFVGAVVLVPLDELIRSLLGQQVIGLYQIIYGGVLIAVALAMPRGLVGWWNRRMLSKGVGG